MSPIRLIFDKAVKPVCVFLRESVIGLIEWRYGIRTRGRIELSALGLGNDKNRKYYGPSRWTTLGRILRKREVGPRDVFIDFGSGLGRVVFQAASRYRFQRVVGVELCEQLNEVAKANIERNRHRLRCKDIQLITSDALNYEIPDDASVAYFANPFTGIIFETVIQRLLSSVDRNPRPLRVIYFNPVEHEFLMATGRLRLIRRLRGFRPTADWSRSNTTYMYEVVSNGDKQIPGRDHPRDGGELAAIRTQQPRFPLPGVDHPGAGIGVEAVNGQPCHSARRGDPYISNDHHRRGVFWRC